MEDTIRKRRSYMIFKHILYSFRKSELEGMEALHKELDRRSAYGSFTKSMYARRSLDLLIKDEKLI